MCFVHSKIVEILLLLMVVVDDVFFVYPKNCYLSSVFSSYKQTYFIGNGIVFSIFVSAVFSFFES